MAVTTEPWRHDGDNSWNNLVRAVNQILENPPDNTDCDPIAPLPEVDECHLWSIDDINDMQAALEQTCPDISLTRVENCDKWEKQIIDDIEAAMAQAWCDCETLNECVPPCDNQAGFVETFLGSFTLTTCTEEPSNNCATQASLSQTLWNEYVILEADFITEYNAYCVLVEEANDLQDELDTLTAAKDAACTADPGGALCISLTAQVSAKQAELDAKIAERDAKLAEANTARADMIDKAAETFANAQNAIHQAGATPIIDMLILDEPWTNWECDDPLKTPTCGGNLDRCRVDWRIQRRNFAKVNKNVWDCSTFDAPGFPKSWFTLLDGVSTVDGGIVVKPFSTCRSRDTDACFSSNCGGGSCPPCQSVESFTHEYRQLATFPPVTSAFACNTFEPCTPGA